MSFSEKILLWYSGNKRSLPWRNTRDPYKIWLSEIMLQQTRVAQGLPYYLKFNEAFPTVEHLANASEEQVLKLWQGLGYYSRARNLHATAKMVVKVYDGVFPNTYSELLKLKGVGDYTASAIASICFDEPQPVVDGNVYRVLARYFGVDTPINSTNGIKYFKQLAREVMNTGNIRDYNQAIMEFGAIQCAPKKPNCARCPLNGSCVALQKNLVDLLPVKINKTKVKKRYFNYLVMLDTENQTRLQQRKGKGIWQNLWEFPLFETKTEIGLNEIKNHLIGDLKLSSSTEILLYNKDQIVHKLSHQHLYTKFWIVKIDARFDKGITLKQLDEFPVPVLIADLIKTLKNSYF
ncbi:A/G-specific adenine glycosylase [uncultured Kriegella sp.]|uniref:A/G-specific adenine glycosylase n=1 Tax=uncultured Kriegella sp. TaxID=1798910 RepID=UPI0030DCD345|tara:strand:+ start:338066 stop:339112 length:1047 start_codon:yes stop_codon:yes gene_type:complete